MLPWWGAGGNKGKKGSVNGKKAEESDIFKRVRMIMQRKFDPVTHFLLYTVDCSRHDGSRAYPV